jgi:hypothetical protein
VTRGHPGLIPLSARSHQRCGEGVRERKGTHEERDREVRRERAPNEPAADRDRRQAPGRTGHVRDLGPRVEFGVLVGHGRGRWEDELEQRERGGRVHERAEEERRAEPASPAGALAGGPRAGGPRPTEASAYEEWMVSEVRTSSTLAFPPAATHTKSTPSLPLAESYRGGKVWCDCILPPSSTSASMLTLNAGRSMSRPKLDA